MTTYLLIILLIILYIILMSIYNTIRYSENKKKIDFFKDSILINTLPFYLNTNKMFFFSLFFNFFLIILLSISDYSTTYCVSDREFEQWLNTTADATADIFNEEIIRPRLSFYNRMHNRIIFLTTQKNAKTLEDFLSLSNEGARASQELTSIDLEIKRAFLNIYNHMLVDPPVPKPMFKDSTEVFIENLGKDLNFLKKIHKFFTDYYNYYKNITPSNINSFEKIQININSIYLNIQSLESIKIDVEEKKNTYNWVDDSYLMNESDYE